MGAQGTVRKHSIRTIERAREDNLLDSLRTDRRHINMPSNRDKIETAS